MGFMSRLLGKKENKDPELLGKNLSALVLFLGSFAETKQLMKEMNFNEKEIERFTFCLVFFGMAHAVFWVNYSKYPETQRVLDAMLDNIMNSLDADKRHLRIGDYILDANEMALIDAQANKDTKTSYYTLVATLYDRRVQLYHEGIIQQMELAYKAKAAKESQKDDFFAIDSMGKIFAPQFSGNEYMSNPRLFMSISLFLATFSNKVIQGVNDVMKPVNE